MPFLTMAKEMSASSQLLPAYITSMITAQALIYQGIRIFLCLQAICALILTTTLLEAMIIRKEPESSMWQIIMSVLVKSSGHGAAAILDRPGIEISQMKTDRILS